MPASPLPMSGFLLSAAALLLAPGPTNMLMTLSSTQEKPAPVAVLIAAEILGYLSVIVPLTILGAGFLVHWPSAALMVKAMAGLWVLFLAIRLWNGRRETADAGFVNPCRIYLTTVLNPKALVFALVLLPSPQNETFLSYLVSFAILVAVIGFGWNRAGRLMTEARNVQMIQRLASLWLGMIGATLLAGTMQIPAVSSGALRGDVGRASLTPS